MKEHDIESLKQALQTVEHRELRAYDRLDDPLPPYSEEFEQKMQKLFRAERKWTWTFVKNRRRRTFCVLCALFLIFTMSLSVSAVREPLFQFIKEVQKDGIKFYAQSTDGPTSIVEHYTTDLIPEGYELRNEIRHNNFHTTEWRLDDQYISLDQGTLYGSSVISVSRKESDGEMLALRGTEVFHTTAHGIHLFLWSESGYTFTFCCPDSIPWEDIVSIMESIHPEAT